MAVYNSGFPINYGYYQQPIMQQPQIQIPQQQMIPQQMQQPIQQQMQQPVQQYPTVQSGFVRVRNENEARMYPVAPGNSVTFIDEVQPYCYTKTVNMGQLDRPIFEKYRLVKEEDNPVQQHPVEQSQKPIESPQIDVSRFVTKDVIDGFRSDLDNIRSDMETFKTDLYGIAGKKKPTAKKEVASDE